MCIGTMSREYKEKEGRERWEGGERREECRGEMQAPQTSLSSRRIFPVGVTTAVQQTTPPYSACMVGNR